uniref:Uncharacterized protein n=1 Tax=Entomoneis paludosa TaxID=265537 RepID=A0A7S3DVU1_9STRA
MSMIVKKWRAKTNQPQYLKDNSPSQDHLSVDECERIIVALLVERVLVFHVHFTAYSSVAYIRLGPLGQQMIQSPNPKMIVRLPKGESKAVASAKSSNKPRKKAAPDSGGGWLETKPKAKRKKAATKKTAAKKGTTAKRKRVTKRKTATKPAAKKRAATKTAKAPDTKKPARRSTSTAETEVIDLFSDEDDVDDDDEEENEEPSSQSQIANALWKDDDEEESSESEFEFE